VPPDENHLRWLLKETVPTVVVACGRQAYDAMLPLCKSLRLLAMPHPVARLKGNSNALWRMAGEFIENKSMLAAGLYSWSILLTAVQIDKEWKDGLGHQMPL
jgi:hypothetical protein